MDRGKEEIKVIDNACKIKKMELPHGSSIFYLQAVLTALFGIFKSASYYAINQRSPHKAQ